MAGCARLAAVPIVLALAAWTASGDGQEDAGFGYSVSSAGDVNNDGFDDVIVGAPYYDTAVVQEGMAFLYLGSESGLSPTQSWTASGGDEPGARYGSSVSSAGDVNNDGFDDVIVSNVSGDTFLYFGTQGGLESEPSWKSSNEDHGTAGFGRAVSCAGDVNNDGFDDVIVGASNSAFLFLGSASGLSTIPVWISTCEQDGAQYGYCVASAGDVNDDGYDDVIVGALSYYSADELAGKVFLYLGSETGPSTTPAWTSSGDDQEGALFCKVSSAGDVNNDGFDDVIVGASHQDIAAEGEGKAFLYLGSASGLMIEPAWISSGDDLPYAAFGFSVSTARDVNGDGFSDVIIGAAYERTYYRGEGKVFLYLGSESGLSETPAWVSRGDKRTGAWLGFSVASAGDVNNDGFDDVVFGAPGDVTSYNGWPGKAYLHTGSIYGICGPDTPCDDGDPCTHDDTCSEGNCSGTAYTCDDDNPCTADMCNSDGTCSHTNVEGACDDGEPCTEGDTCQNGVCTGGTDYCVKSDGCFCGLDSGKMQSPGTVVFFVLVGFLAVALRRKQEDEHIP